MVRQTLYRLLRLIKSPHIPEEYDQVLNHYSEYYRRLKPELKKVFKYRLNRLLRELRFESSSGFPIESSMKILIACALTQLTFGLRKFILSKYRKIDVVPHDYTYPGWEEYRFLGDVNVLHRVITLSWQHVEKGFIIPDDAMNLALHEMSHCLCFEDREGSLWSKFLNTEKFKEWEYQSVEEFYRIREEENSFIRAYGGTNMYEMFAVSIEAFFEQPLEFKIHLPKMYHMLAELLNQDPSDANDPILSAGRANHYY